MLTIGRLSRLFGVSAKTLRHYERIGLFAPAQVDASSSYRYYAPTQISALAQILRLRAVRMPLEAIRTVLAAPEDEAQGRLVAALLAHEARLQGEIADRQAALEATRSLIANSRIRSHIMMSMQQTTLPEFRLIGLELEDGKLESIGPLWDRLFAYSGAIPNAEPGVCYGACLGSPGGDLRYLAGYRVAPDAAVPEGLATWTVPAQKYALVTHRGPYREMTATFQRAYESGLAENGLTAVEGIDLERYEYARCPTPDGPQTEVDLYLPIA